MIQINFKKWLGWALVAVLSLMMLLAATTLFLTATELGSKLIARIASSQLEGSKIEGVTGSLYSGLNVESLSVAIPDGNVDLFDLVLEIDPIELLDQAHLLVHKIEARQILIALSPAETNQQENSADSPLIPAIDGTIEIPSLPIQVTLQRLHIENIQINDTEIEDVSTSLSWNEQSISLRQLGLTSGDLSIDTSGQVEQNAELPAYSLTVKWQQNATHGHADIRGQGLEMLISHTLHGAHSAPIQSAGFVRLDDTGLLESELDHNTEQPSTRINTRIDVEHRTVLTKIQGSIDNHALNLSARVEQHTDGWQIDNLVAKIAEAINLEGHLFVSTTDTASPITSSFRGEINLQINDLGSLHADLAGSMTATLNAQEDVLSWQADSPGLQAFGATAGPFTSSGQVGSSDTTTLSALLSFDNITYGEYKMIAPDLSVAGTLSKADIKFTSNFGQLLGSIEIVSEQEIRASILDASYVLLDEYRFAPDKTFNLTYKNNLLNISSHCWRGLGDWCLQSTNLQTQDDVALSGTLENVPLAAANPLLPPDYQLGADSVVLGTWNATLRNDEVRAQGKLSTKNVTATLPHMSQAQNVPMLEATYDISPETWLIEARTVDDHIDLQFKTQGLPQTQFEATGEFRISLPHLSPWLPSLDTPTGQVSGNFTASGLPDALQLSASGQIEDGELLTLDPKTQWNDISSEWHIEDDKWRLTLSSQVAELGAVNIVGQGQGLDSTGQAQLSVKGHQLLIPSDFGIVTSDADLSVKAADQKISVTGQIDITHADLEVTTLPSSTLKPAQDVQVVSRKSNEQATAATLSGEIKINVHDNVSFTAAGITSKLKGSLVARIRDDELTTLNGALDIVDGSLEASGQVLAIETGRIVFSGDPNNPYIDVVAIRQIQNHTPPLKVGLQITGPVDNLSTKVYSNPILSETRALSFLVLGRDFEAESDGDTNQALLGAALGFGLNKSQGVVEELRGTLGLDELSTLASQQSGVAIVAAKQLTDKLYVRYRYNALSQLSALIIRYHLTDRWRIEATNDAAASIDLLYETTK